MISIGFDKEIELFDLDWLIFGRDIDEDDDCIKGEGNGPSTDEELFCLFFSISFFVNSSSVDITWTKNEWRDATVLTFFDSKNKQQSE